MKCYTLDHTKPEEIAAVAALYDEARLHLRNQGINQWQDGAPNAEMAEADRQAGNAYVIRLEGVAVATACICSGFEPTYAVIFNGEWIQREGPYIFLHRVAVSERQQGKGLSSLFFQKAVELAYDAGLASIRCDTHPDNKAMQRIMEKNGLFRCGTILLANGDERVAYERPL